MPSFSMDEERNWYPVTMNDAGRFVPSPDPADWEALTDRYEQEAFLFLRAVGAELEMRYRLGCSADEARSIADNWLSRTPPGGSHTMRVVARIAYTGTSVSAVELYLNELGNSPTDLPPGSFQGVIQGEVSHYDRRFVEQGGSIVNSDPNFDTSVSIGDKIDQVRARVLSNTQNNADPA